MHILQEKYLWGRWRGLTVNQVPDTNKNNGFGQKTSCTDWLQGKSVLSNPLFSALSVAFFCIMTILWIFPSVCKQTLKFLFIILLYINFIERNMVEIWQELHMFRSFKMTQNADNFTLRLYHYFLPSQKGFCYPNCFVWFLFKELQVGGKAVKAIHKNREITEVLKVSKHLLQRDKGSFKYSKNFIQSSHLINFLWFLKDYQSNNHQIIYYLLIADKC